MSPSIDIGFEVGSGKRVSIPINHAAVLGQTQVSGKTTTLEAMVARSGVRAIAFITKPGEKAFRTQREIPAFFTEATAGEYWRYVVAIIESSLDVKLGWRERGMVMKLCQDYEKEVSKVRLDAKGKTKRQAVTYSWRKPRTLADLQANIDKALPHIRGTEEMICMQLQEYLRPVVREISRIEFSDKLDLRPGINVMDISGLSDGLKTLVIRSVIEWVHKHGRRVVVIIPEAWKFIPEGRTTPVKLALEGLIREGAGIGNFVWMDSQDLRGVDKNLLRSVIVWLFGVQRQKNEVASTLASIPDYPKPTATEVMQLGKGEFYVCYGTTLVRCYVQPAGMEDLHAQAIARGEERKESWIQIAKSLDAEREEQEAFESGAGSLGERDDLDMASDRRDREAGDSVEDLSAEAAEKDGDETMWKEKYEELQGEHRLLVEEHKNLVEAHDLMARRLADLEAKVSASASSQKEEGGAELRLAAPHPPQKNESANGHSIPTDAVGRLLEQFKTQAQKDPVVLRILQERPELEIRREIKNVVAHASSVKGMVAVLISEKFFDNPRPFDDLRKELIRRGKIDTKTPSRNIYQAVDELLELGFLTREGTDALQAVPGMKIHIVESRA